jgi:short-subunit dehydrogenase
VTSAGSTFTPLNGGLICDRGRAVPLSQIYTAKVAAVTGAAGGLGRALAQELAARGYRVALLDCDREALQQARTDLAATGAEVSEHCADVGVALEVERAAAEIRAAHGAVDLLVNNAAISSSAAFCNMTAEEFEHILRVNFLGAVHGCRVFLPQLLETRGRILNVSSCFAWVGYPRKTAYAASKGAMRAFSQCLRMELAGSGVAVTELYPRPLPTAIVRRGGSDSEEMRAREEAFLARRGQPIERVARRAIDGLARDPRRIVIGGDYCLLDWIARVSPGLAARISEAVARRNGF